jgi:hypothetical protein
MMSTSRGSDAPAGALLGGLVEPGGGLVELVEPAGELLGGLVEPGGGLVELVEPAGGERCSESMARTIADCRAIRALVTALGRRALAGSRAGGLSADVTEAL